METTGKQQTLRAQRDYELVLLARDKGDQKAYADLLATYREPVYYMLLKMTHNTWDADDLTIEAFGKAFKSLDEYNPEYAFSTWLFRIAANNCIDFIRRQKNYTVSIDQGTNNVENVTPIAVRNLASENKSPEEEYISEQTKVWVRDIVKKLKPHYRILVEKRYFEEKSYEEIATDLNMPLGSVKAKLFRARNLLLNMINSSRGSV
ncbi:MAG: sigma-70 family RNA polymerase sigma factor [Bacteroidales bacterium]|nr:sigma-70 family RNA polymerase sigma factor [Bacteroidales bacterium]MBQ6754500.1 sigma-70 family RNA polymerase sigma factor [Bacteroidales bacterium]MDY6381602.1 sigma-70 family RNA polymerase sigma factor [Bacteroidales bacterium]MDY6395149.1 sigma-70 family RNA polymerase sigma factor [Bacteroidales bacterium]MEE3412749.1 sigma-70 family RNA polymerase sigma factor [Bacteroidales bacterium]